MRMKYCTNCGTELNIMNPKFCPECGQSFGKAPDKEEEEKEEGAPANKSFSKPEVTIEMGGTKPIAFGDLIKQGEDASSPEEVAARRRRPHEFSEMTKDQIKRNLLKECSSTKRVEEISED